jgi:hypothetical protein
MEYLLLKKQIPVEKISLYKPTKPILRLMRKNYGLWKRLGDDLPPNNPLGLSSDFQNS